MSTNFDPGPPPSWADLFSEAPLGFYQQRPKQFRFEFGPVYYRGRLDGTARVLVVGQDPSTDEILAQRTLVGDAGQRVQGLLRKLGLASSYLMLNTFLYGIHGQFTKPMATLSASDPVLAYRNRLFDHAGNKCSGCRYRLWEWCRPCGRSLAGSPNAADFPASASLGTRRGHRQLEFTVAGHARRHTT